MEQSILLSTKKMLGLNEEYDAFDLDIITNINTVFLTLQQLGIGPQQGFMIDGDDEVWDDFTGGRINLNAIRTYVFLRVRLLFDPPAASHHVAAIKEQIDELEHRLRYDREVDAWQPSSLSLP